MNLCFWRKFFPPGPVEDEGDDQLDWELGMLNRGFAHWMDHPPPHGVTVELYRRSWPTGYVMERNELAPEANVWGLWWRIPGDQIIDGEVVHAWAPHLLEG